jgi:pseudaminic acid biosynthesis-associated methylase
VAETGGSAAGDAKRLESLWQGEFGDAYTQRNAAAGEGREPFWKDLHGAHPFSSVLEVGCNLGGNLRWLSKILPPREVYGIDVNESALARVRASYPGVNAVWARGRELPFRDRFFDLTFTTGVLIHQPPETLPLVMSEIVRCSRRYVLCGEYYADQATEVPYRGQSGALYKCDFGGIYQRCFPELALVRKGFLAKGVGSWDDVTWWLFERRG